MAKSTGWARGSEPMVQGAGSLRLQWGTSSFRSVSRPVPGQPCLEGGHVTGPAHVRPDSPSALRWD